MMDYNPYLSGGIMWEYGYRKIGMILSPAPYEEVMKWHNTDNHIIRSYGFYKGVIDKKHEKYIPAHTSWKNDFVAKYGKRYKKYIQAGTIDDTRPIVAHAVYTKDLQPNGDCTFINLYNEQMPGNWFDIGLGDWKSSKAVGTEMCIFIEKRKIETPIQDIHTTLALEEISA